MALVRVILAGLARTVTPVRRDTTDRRAWTARCVKLTAPAQKGSTAHAHVWRPGQGRRVQAAQ